MTTTYISGPMSGYEDWNERAFAEVRDRLRAQGRVVLCPSEMSSDGTFPRTHEARPLHMRRDVEKVLEADEVVVLAGWEKSPGACLEVAIALEVGLPVWDVDEGGAARIGFEHHPWYGGGFDPRNPSYVDLDVFQGEVREWAYRNFGSPGTGRTAHLEVLFDQVRYLLNNRVDQADPEQSFVAYSKEDVSKLASMLVAIENAPPDAPSDRPLFGVVEELGELAHAHLKGLQGIRHTPEEIADKKVDAVGDVLVYLADYCNREGIALGSCVERAWGEVKQRDWLSNPATGVATEGDAEGGC